MDFPSSTKPAAMGAVAGAVALAIVGFTWGGWMTASKAAMAASNQSEAAVVAALLPICVQQAGADPNTVAKIAEIKGASSYQRSEMVTNAGWATMPGATGADRGVARACAEALTK